MDLAYKPDVDDVRESPAVEVVKKLAASGAFISAYEPYKTSFQIDNIRMAANLEDAIRDADLILLLVAHTQFKELDPFLTASKTGARILLDTVGGWNTEEWNSAGFECHRLGSSERL